MSSDRKLTVILGAGASHDCIPPNTATVRPEYKPPLTQHLFSIRNSFDRILTRYPKVMDLSQDIRTRLAQGQNLEAILQEYESESNIVFKKQFWQVPLYLQELLGEVSANYVIAGGTSFGTLVREVERSQYKQVMYMTLNYDLFMERALSQFYLIEFDHMSKYIFRDSHWSLVKLHGSVNWGRKLMNLPEWKGDELLTLNSLDSDLLLDSSIKLLAGHGQDKRYSGKTYYYPALAVPIAGKDAFVCPQQHVDHAKHFLDNCTDFLIIGFSGLDQHVLKLLKNVKEVRKLTIVDENNVTGEEVLERIAKKNSEFSNPPFGGPLHSATFADFIQGQHLRGLLKV